MSTLRLNKLSFFDSSDSSVAIDTGSILTGTAAQFKITGGTANQALVTDGAGNLSFTDVTSDPTMGGDLTGLASNAQIVANAVGTVEIATDAVTATEIAAGAVGSSEIAANAVGSSEIATDAVGSTEIATGAVGATEIASTIDLSSKTVTLPAASVTAHIPVTPTVTSLTYPGSATNLAPAGGETLIITGTNFISGMEVEIGLAAAPTVTVDSVTQITITTPALTSATYTLVVIHPNGHRGSISVSYSDAPSWTTGAGVLGSMTELTAGSFTIVATSDSTITYAQQSGTLPSGITLAPSTGIISGTGTSDLAADTLYNFTMRATDQENQYSDRSFGITVNVVPSITSLDYPGDDTALDPAGGQELIITGASFEAGITTTIDSTSVAVTRDSATQLTIPSTPAKAAATYTNGLVATNPSGLSATANIDYSDLPVWTTPAGAISGGPFYQEEVISVTVVATGAGLLTYALISGTLPTGTTLDANTGVISGTVGTHADETTYNFTIEVTDTQNQSVSRAFSILIEVAFPVSNSLRMNSQISPYYMTRDFQAGGDPENWTISCWIKRGGDGIGSNETIWGSNKIGSETSDWVRLGFDDNNRLKFHVKINGGLNTDMVTSRFFRDTSAWYHIVVHWNTPVGVIQADRVRIYVNGSQITSYVTEQYPSSETEWSSMDLSEGRFYIGDLPNTGDNWDTLSGYMSELNYVSGQSLTHTSFGRTDNDTNQWLAKKYSGAFGTLGFYLDFKLPETSNTFVDSSTSASNVHSFVTTSTLAIDYLVVGGGGGGGANRGGGGGGGGVYTGSTSLSAGTHAITIGKGGDGRPYGAVQGIGETGGTTQFSSIQSAGGGGGGSDYGNPSNSPGAPGASPGGSGGGGGCRENQQVQSGGAGAGNGAGAGGASNASQNYSGAGGGASGTGSAGSGAGGYPAPRNGGPGVNNDYRTGSNIGYGGGGGSGNNGYSMCGGTHGGGHGGNADGWFPPGHGFPGTGGGGGGGAGDTGNGGSGVVVIRYVAGSPQATGGIITSHGGYQVHTFTYGRGTHRYPTANGNVHHNAGVSKFNTTSIMFDESNNGDYISFPRSVEWDTRAEDFTIETWVKFDPTAGDQIIATTTTSNQENVQRFVRNTNGTMGWDNYRAEGDGGGQSYSYSLITAATIADANWHHVAVVRDSDTMRFYIDGVADANTTSIGTAELFSHQQDLVIGRYRASEPVWLDGYLDEFRWSNVCRYPDGTTFSVPTTTFTEDDNTLLLIHSNFEGGIGKDGSGNSNNLATIGIVLHDQVEDSPTNNWAIMNKLTALADNSGGTVPLRHAGLGSEIWGGWARIDTTLHAPKSGKWYAEWHIGPQYSTGQPYHTSYGVLTSRATTPGNVSWCSVCWYSNEISSSTDGSNSTIASAPNLAFGDIIGVALDEDNSEVRFYHNGVEISGSPFPLPDTYLTYGFGSRSYDKQRFICNFGQDATFVGYKSPGTVYADANGLGEFHYQPPTGALALCTANLPAVTIVPQEHFKPIIYTGTGTTHNVTGVGFKPDFTWLRNYSAGSGGMWLDSIRGVDKFLQTSNNNSQADDSGGSNFVSWDSDGFTVANAGNLANTTGENYISYNWLAGGATPTQTYVVTVAGSQDYYIDGFATAKPVLDLQEGGTYIFDESDSTNSSHLFGFSTTADGTFGGGAEYITGVTHTGTPGQAGAKTTITVAASAPQLYYYCVYHGSMGGTANTTVGGSSNFQGTTSSIVSANQTAGFSIVRFTGGGAQTTIGHGLSQAPDLIILKRYNSSGNFNIGNNAGGVSGTNTADEQEFAPNSTYLTLNGMEPSADGSTGWSDTNPTSTVFTIGTDGEWSGSGDDFIVYCFHRVEGLTELGRYRGNGNADGEHIYTGFYPSYVMIKRFDSGDHTLLTDNLRAGNTYNHAGNHDFFNVDSTDTSGRRIELLANGFKITETDQDSNTENGQYFYWAIGSQPFKYGNAR